MDGGDSLNWSWKCEKGALFICRQNICTWQQFLDHGGWQDSFNSVKYSWSCMCFTLKLIVSIIYLAERKYRKNLGRNTDAIYLKMYFYTSAIFMEMSCFFSSSVPVDVFSAQHLKVYFIVKTFLLRIFSRVSILKHFYVAQIWEK